MLTRRLQILIDERRYEALDREARRTGKSIAELIRTSVDTVYGVDRTARGRAVEDFLAAEPMSVEDWDQMKADMMDSLTKLDRLPS